MSLLTFFPEQRHRWFNDTKEWPAEHVDGGISALLRAEVAFLKLPIYNATSQLFILQQELDNVTYKADQVRREHKLVVARHEATALKLKDEKKSYKQLEKRAGQSQHTLKRLAEVAEQDDFAPEVRLRYMQELMKQHFALVQAQEAGKVVDATLPVAE